MELVMNNQSTLLATIAALAIGLMQADTANADELGIAFRAGDAYVYYAHDYDRRYDRHGPYYRYDRDYRRRYKHSPRHGRRLDRLFYAHERWHWYNDGRRDRHYRRDHKRLHRELGIRHRDIYRRGY
jgi:hypothetical protein